MMAPRPRRRLLAHLALLAVAHGVDDDVLRKWKDALAKAGEPPLEPFILRRPPTSGTLSRLQT